MSEILVAEKIGETVWAIVKPFAVFIACAAIGFAGAELFEHSGPRPSINVGFIHWSPFGQSLKTQRDIARTLAAADQGLLANMTANRDGWMAADKMCESARVDENKADANRVNEAFGVKQQAGSTSFNNGYAAGKAFGAQSCGDPHAPKPDPAVIGGAKPGSMRISPADADVGQLFAAGAYKAR